MLGCSADGDDVPVLSDDVFPAAATDAPLCATSYPAATDVAQTMVLASGRKKDTANAHHLR
jgi:hypothetical protein